MKKIDEEKFQKELGFPVETLEKISEDTKHKECLIDSRLTAVNFDEVAEKYCKENGMMKYPATNDALYLWDEHWYFIEFKNGEIVDDSRSGDDGIHAKVSELREKILSSLNVLFSVAQDKKFKEKFSFFEPSIMYTCKNMTYILVYNDLKNKKITKADEAGWIKQINNGLFDKEIEHFRTNYRDLIEKRKQKSFEKMLSGSTTTLEETEKVKKYFEHAITSNWFISLIHDIRNNMDESLDGAFDDILDDVSQDAGLPLLRFGLDKYANREFKEVFTYTGDVVQPDGTYKHGEFYKKFTKVFEEKESELKRIEAN